ncbi:MAG: PilX N-terminal domain-containing pilus assembly protein [Gammaproteobacteria bacterium]|nr:PilX N-terminal domain-containing pilus assembly protein [Gammaproteobacteria bacterium]
MNHFSNTGTLSGIHGQRGAALLVALSFLVVITLISLTSMRSSTTELRLAGNYEERAAAEQIAQSGVDNVLGNSNNFIVTGTAGTEKSFTLDKTTIAEFDSALMRVKVKEGVTANPPRNLGVSADKFQGTQFYIEADYNNVGNGRGDAFIGQGLVLLVPKT